MRFISVVPKISRWWGIIYVDYKMVLLADLSLNQVVILRL